jgi:Cytochrome P460
MKNKLITFIFGTLLSSCLWNMTACQKDTVTPPVVTPTPIPAPIPVPTPTTKTTDVQLYELAKGTDGFTWYKKVNTLLPKSSGTGHTEALLRTRYNAAAATKLDDKGKIVAGAAFPEGSLIVKELYANATTQTKYAILYKKADSPDADAKGWVWGYLNTDGSVVLSASAKGGACISCHSQANSIAYMLMNKYFP